MGIKFEGIRAKGTGAEVVRTDEVSAKGVGTERAKVQGTEQEGVVAEVIGAEEGGAEGEGAADVGRLVRNGKVDLGAGAAGTADDVRAELRSQDIRDFARDDLRLIVAAPPLPRPVERHGNHYIHVDELRRGGQALAQQMGEMPPGRQSAPVFQVPGNMAVIRGGVVEKQRRGKRIGLVSARRTIRRGSQRRIRWAQNRGICA